MNPRLVRPDPPYLQLVSHYRGQIKNGDLKDGDRLPSVRAMAEEWGVAPITVSKAMRHLANEGLVATSNQGVFVTWGETSTYTPRDRLAAMSRTGRIYPPSERAHVYASEVVTAPDYVADAMLLPREARVVRRERVTFHGDNPVTHSISWLPGDLADVVPELVSTDRIPGGTIGAIRDRTGREVTGDTYRECARAATAAEAERLGLPVGAPVLYGQNTWYEAPDKVLEFGEYVIPPNRWVTVAP